MGSTHRACMMLLAAAAAAAAVAIADRPAVGAPMYQTTNLGTTWAAGLTASGQVVQSSNPTVYNPYGPDAGRKLPLAMDQASGVSPNGRVVGTDATQGRIPSLADANRPGAAPVASPQSGDGTAYGSAVNDRGQVTGMLSTADFVNRTTINHAFLSGDGAVSDLGTLGGASSWGRAINASGEVVGEAQVASGLGHAFLYSHGTMTDLGVQPGYASSSAVGINDAGAVIGRSQTAPGEQPFLMSSFVFKNGSMIDLGKLTADADATVANAINNAGAVVGGSWQGASESAFLWKDGVMTDLNTLIPSSSDFHLREALYINDAGQIVARGRDARGAELTYLLTPEGMPTPVAPVLSGAEVPEPSLIAFAALVAVAAAARRASANGRGRRAR